jgi:hypothetical protein
MYKKYSKSMIKWRKMFVFYNYKGLLMIGQTLATGSRLDSGLFCADEGPTFLPIGL